MNEVKSIVLVLRSGGDFSFRDVELISRHILGKWLSNPKPRIICLWDKASEHYDFGNIEILPLTNNWPRWWSRMTLYSPEMEQYRPFLYIDLDTVVVKSLENIFRLVVDPSLFIPLEDFYQKGQLATGLAWIPANSEKIKGIWRAWLREGVSPGRMDYFLRMAVVPDTFWQRLTNTIYDFKPSRSKVLMQVPEDANLICFHGKPRIFQAAEASMSIQWVRDYVNQTSFASIPEKHNVTVIIPYNKDRGWLKEAVESVPNDVQLILSQGEGNWPQNFNKALHQAEGAYIKYLHEDDILSPNCIRDSVKAIEDQGVDFVHGNAIQLSMRTGNKIPFKPTITHPTFQNLLTKNVIHSATLMYRREVFQKVGLFNEDNKYKAFEEYEFNLRCLQAGMRIGYCDSVLACYRKHPQQQIRTTNRLIKQRNRREMIEMFKQGQNRIESVVYSQAEV